MNKIELWQGDCLELMDKISDKSIDMILCDLPYGTTACKWDSVIDLNILWKQYTRIITDCGIICLFGQEPFSSNIRMSNLEMYRYDWIWKKQRPSNFQLMGYQPGRVHENIIIFSKGRVCYVKNGNNAKYNPQLIKREKPRTSNVKIYGDTKTNILHAYNKGERDNIKTYAYKQPTTILEFNTVEKKQITPYTKACGIIRIFDKNIYK